MQEKEEIKIWVDDIREVPAVDKFSDNSKYCIDKEK